jgi:cyclohexadieny/prephenate dehydrogenase
MFLEKLFKNFGSKIEFMDEFYHDKVLAITSHLPHLIAYSIVDTANNLESDLKNDVIRYSATGFRDFTRLASSDPTMWRDVFLNNSEAVLEMLQRFNEDLSALQKLIRKKDSNELYNFFKNSKKIRNKIIEAKQHLPEASKLK